MERAKAKENCTKDSDFNPSVVSREVLEHTAIGVGELAGHKESQCWIKQEYAKNHPGQDPLQRDIREWSSSSEKGQGNNQSKGKGKGIGKRKHPGTGNQNQDKAGSPDEETGQRKLDDFGIMRQRVEFVGDVPEHNDNFEAHKVDRAAYVFCVQKCTSGMTD